MIKEKYHHGVAKAIRSILKKWTGSEPILHAIDVTFLATVSHDDKHENNLTIVQKAIIAKDWKVLFQYQDCIPNEDRTVWYLLRLHDKSYIAEWDSFYELTRTPKVHCVWEISGVDADEILGHEVYTFPLYDGREPLFLRWIGFFRGRKRDRSERHEVKY